MERSKDEKFRCKKSTHSRTKNYECIACNYQSENKDKFERHLRKHHYLSSYMCDNCHLSVNHPSKLQAHFKSGMCKSAKSIYIPNKYEVMLNAPSTIKSSMNEIINSKAQSGNVICLRVVYPYNEAETDFRFVTESSANNEVPILSNFVKLKTSEHGVVKLSTVCELCNVTCLSFQETREHFFTHWNFFPAHCKYCAKILPSSRALIRHLHSSKHDHLSEAELLQAKKAEGGEWDVIRRESQKPKNFARSCNKCNMNFKDNVLLSVHLLTHHKVLSVIRTYCCGSCNFESNVKSDLEKHIQLSHSSLLQTKLFQCPVCDKTFKVRSKAVKHRETMHSPLQQVPYTTEFIDNDCAKNKNTCFVCMEAFIGKKEWCSHINKHRVWIPNVKESGPIPKDLFEQIGVVDMPVLKINVQLSEEVEIDVAENTLMNKEDEKRVRKSEISFSVSQLRRRNKNDDDQDLTKKERLLCPYCLLLTDSLQELHQHKLEVHKLVTAFKCVHNNCLKIFNNVHDYQSHSDIHSQLSFICNICNWHCSTMYQLSSHKSASHRSMHVLDTGFCCQVCHKTFVSESALKQHMDCDQNHFQCKTCGYVYRTHFELKDHMLKHKSAETLLCDQCGSTFVNRLALNRHKQVHGKRTHSCEKCGKKFNKLEHVRRHVLSIHTSEKPYQCTFPGCVKQFKRKDKMHEHLKKHSDDRPYRCKMCGRSYRYREGLLYHEKKSHKVEGCAAYKCSHCDVVFNRPNMLKQHLEQEHNIKRKHPYQCNHCTRTFTRPERLNRHLENIHKVQVKWRFQCRICTKGFAGLKTYNSHMELCHWSKSKNSLKQSLNSQDVLQHINVDQPSTIVEWFSHQTSTRQPVNISYETKTGHSTISAHYAPSLNLHQLSEASAENIAQATNSVLSTSKIDSTFAHPMKNLQQAEDHSPYIDAGIGEPEIRDTYTNAQFDMYSKKRAPVLEMKCANVLIQFGDKEKQPIANCEIELVQNEIEKIDGINDVDETSPVMYPYIDSLTGQRSKPVQKLATTLSKEVTEILIKQFLVQINKSLKTDNLDHRNINVGNLVDNENFQTINPTSTQTQDTCTNILPNNYVTIEKKQSNDPHQTQTSSKTVTYGNLKRPQL